MHGIIVDGCPQRFLTKHFSTVWLTQAQLCELYQTSKSNISEHIKHIFEEDELEEVLVVRKFRTTGADGKNYNIIHYNLDIDLEQ